jgi:hypothetical protein
MTSKYDRISDYAREYARQRIPGQVTYRRCTREGGHHDNLSVIVRYTTRTAKDGRVLWQSCGEQISTIPSYISTAPLLDGGLHNRPVDKYPI